MSQTTLNVAFSGADQAAKTRPLAIDIQPGLSGNFSLRLRVFPHNVERFAVSAGTLTRENNGSRHSFDALRFNGSDFASLKYWTDKPPAIRFQQVFFDAEGQPINGVSFRWDAQRCGFVASAAVYAVLQVEYQAPFAVYLYLFDRNDPRPALALAYENKRTTTLDLELEGNESGQFVELYRVASQIVTDPSGSWEFPPNFPDDGTFPGGISGPDTGTFMLSERIHEVAAITSLGDIDERRLFIAYEQPYTGSPNYTPDWALQRGNPPPGFETLWLDVDWSEIETALAARYNGIAL